MSREFIFSDSRVIRELKTNYVSVALNTFGYQHENSNTDPNARKLFFQIVDQANLYKGVPKQYLGNPRYPYHPTKSPEGTTQGFYVCDSNGRLKAAVWGLYANYGPKQLLGVVQQHRQRSNVSVKAKKRSAKSLAPKGAAVMAVHSKLSELDGSAVPEGIMDRSRDVLWITQEEIRSLGRGQFPGSLKTRIVLFHLIDTSLGLPEGWAPEDIRKATLSARVKGNSKGRRIEITGEFDLRKANAFFSYKGKIAGEAIVTGADLTDFRLVAEGRATRPTHDDWPTRAGYTMKFAIVPSKNQTDREVLPMLAIYGKETYEAYLNYDVDSPE